MRIQQLDEPELDRSEGMQIVRVDEAKRALIGAGARILFYPTLLYNVLRNKMESEFRWWDEVDQFVLLGAVPFPKDVPQLKRLGVGGVITLNESYETLVPSSVYHAVRMTTSARKRLLRGRLEGLKASVRFKSKGEREKLIRCGRCGKLSHYNKTTCTEVLN